MHGYSKLRAFRPKGIILIRITSGRQENIKWYRIKGLEVLFFSWNTKSQVARLGLRRRHADAIRNPDFLLFFSLVSTLKLVTPRSQNGHSPRYHTEVSGRKGAESVSFKELPTMSLPVSFVYTLLTWIVIQDQPSTGGVKSVTAVTAIWWAGNQQWLG